MPLDMSDALLGDDRDVAKPLRTVKVLLTGFEPFDQDRDGVFDENTSKILAKAYADRERRVAYDHSSGRRIKAIVTGHVLDVTWSNSPGSAASATSAATAGAADVLEDLVRTRRPDVIIATGMGGNLFRAELQARDLDIPNQADNRGVSFTGEGRRQYSKLGDEDAYLMSTLPVVEIEAEWKKAGVRYQERSYNAGGFVCDDVFYRALWIQSKSKIGAGVLSAGFIHVPPGADRKELETAMDIVLRVTLQSLDATKLTTR